MEWTGTRMLLLTKKVLCVPVGIDLEESGRAQGEALRFAPLACMVAGAFYAVIYFLAYRLLRSAMAASIAAAVIALLLPYRQWSGEVKRCLNWRVLCCCVVWLALVAGALTILPPETAMRSLFLIPVMGGLGMAVSCAGKRGNGPESAETWCGTLEGVTAIVCAALPAGLLLWWRGIFPIACVLLVSFAAARLDRIFKGNSALLFAVCEAAAAAAMCILW